jgi:cytochrome b561
VHWLLYLLVLATTLSGWFFASARGWTISWFFLAPLPMLTAQNSPLGQAIGRWHANLGWALLILVGVHVATAFLHLLYYRDRVMRRMLPQI